MPIENTYHTSLLDAIKRHGIGNSLLLIADEGRKKDWFWQKFGKDKIIQCCAPSFSDAMRGKIDFWFDLCQPDIQDLPQTYDSVICHCVLEHCINPYRAIETMQFMCLNRGGILYISVPVFPRPEEKQEIQEAHTIPQYDNWDFFRFTREWFNQISVSLNMSILENEISNGIITFVARTN
jgi:hypothetical protein